MSKKIILHVGSGKAGSTSIQRALLENREKNSDVFGYPVIDNSPGNQVLRFAFCDSSDTPINVKEKYRKNNEENYTEYQDSIKNTFASQSTGYDTLILSSEFWFISSDLEVVNLKNFLKSLGFEEIHILMYLRDPAKYYLSSAQQALKNQSRISQPSNFRYHMLEAIKSWSLMNPASFTVREFERSTLVNSDVVSDFHNYLGGLGIPSHLSLRKTLNETMSAEATQALQDLFMHIDTLNEEDRDESRSKYSNSIKHLIQSGGGVGTKPELRNDIKEFIDASYLQELTIINKLFGLFKEKLDSINNTTCLPPKKVVNFFDVISSYDETVYNNIKDTLFKG
ncbi:hypothetical protein C4K68_25355 [Pokkaliibacter plantistimulans]|uniref:Sulfotransferase domain-containing protein n=1 Tax=Proteobacteria bacterium 228 TaxID=2083153 RepID=A0A2S5KJ55_9PROT|nr:hypothetical protein [Pokkaliibacter plantistimulans]PPC74643.1 hypothetical protein C4K68_25355 [Pokkaliibacter plantistimulans]